jgi:hypothetical protein
MGTFGPQSTRRHHKPVYQTRWKLTKKSVEIEIYDRVHGDLFNVPQLLLPWYSIR